MPSTAPSDLADYSQELSIKDLCRLLDHLGIERARRPAMYELEAGLCKLRVPTVVIVGDEDAPAIDAGSWPPPFPAPGCGCSRALATR
jgi:pimeloyl-ACP methyl ester carboxylesterase